MPDELVAVSRQVSRRRPDSELPVSTRSSQSCASASGLASSARDLCAPSPRAVNQPMAVDAACAAMPH